MSIVDLQLQRQRGVLVPNHREGRAKPQGTDTVAHTASQPGLRGHSIGSTWPYRVVGVGDDWQVHCNGQRQRLVGMTIEQAHDAAEFLAARGR